MKTRFICLFIYEIIYKIFKKIVLNFTEQKYIAERVMYLEKCNDVFSGKV